MCQYTDRRTSADISSSKLFACRHYDMLGTSSCMVYSYKLSKIYSHYCNHKKNVTQAHLFHIAMGT